MSSRTISSVNELTRLAYLDALGVESFVSRADLPGAAATRTRETARTMDNPTLLGAFALGLAGAGHCLGMCGGIAAALNLGGHRSTPVTVSYHGGRIASYTLLGGLLGLGIGLGICALLRAAIPGMPVHTPLEYVVAALAVSLATGVLSGVMPARRAASLDPVESLRAE